MTQQQASILSSEEMHEWKEAFDNIKTYHPPLASHDLLRSLIEQSGFSEYGQPSAFENNFPIVPDYPGSIEKESVIECWVRWNAMAMVHQAYQYDLGGHISTYASIATLYEVGFNHFWKAGDCPDFVFFQGHSTPGIYARSYLEGRLNHQSLQYFRREIAHPQGLSSYPHPWLMPDYWSFPTVSMGLGPMQAISLARLQKHLFERGLLTQKRPVWCFCGDGEMDEPESTALLRLAGRENISDLIFIVNCNLQRLDGPVRSHGKIINELEGLFAQSGWAVIKLIWNESWTQILSYDHNGLLLKKLQELPDIAFQFFARYGAIAFKKMFLESDPNLYAVVQKIPDSLLEAWLPGAHDRKMVYSAYQSALAQSHAKPVVILAHSIKGYGLENSAQGFNTAHNMKHLDTENLKKYAQKWNIPLSLEQIETAQFFCPPDSDPALHYLKEKRQALSGSFPTPSAVEADFSSPSESLLSLFDQSHENAHALSSTMALVRVLGALLRDKNVGPWITPIVADEARTFGMEGLIKQLHIYQPCHTSIPSVDAEEMLPYTESPKGRFFQEGINEAGAAALWLSCATAYRHLQTPLIPFYTYYSMFGFQRVGDFFWAAGDSLARGFLIGATFGKTALSGEGLQHQDGHSLICMSSVPTMRCYEPCFAFEMAYIIHYGLSCFAKKENLIFYITATNEKITQWPMPTDNPNLYEDVISGMYSLKHFSDADCAFLASGPFVIETQKAIDWLTQHYHLKCNLWCVTSFTELRRRALLAQRHNQYQDNDKKEITLEKYLENSPPIIAVSDSWSLHADQIRPWIRSPYCTLGTDGYGRSDTRENLRDHFEVSWKYIALQTLLHLKTQGLFTSYTLSDWLTQLDLQIRERDPLLA